ncbi:MAG: beta-ketoacyl synthase [Acidobacteriaceae bacterium]|nr:beta-ketoacyl synthase [Acidobacteriaceae bacterium]
MPVRVGVFGWGIVAPKSPNIDAFKANLASSDSWLTPFDGFGPDNFLVGCPEFQFGDYQDWIRQRFAPRLYQKLKEKMDTPAQYAIGAFIQSLAQNPGMEEVLQRLGSQAHVYVGTGVGAIGTIYDESIKQFFTQRRWNRFWAAPEHNSELRAWLDGGDGSRDKYADAPRCPESVSDPDEAEKACGEWWAYWSWRSPELQQYLRELAEIDSLSIEGDVETGKLNTIREKEKRHGRLRQKWNAPEPPWNVSANVIWNIHNTPASQISILGKINGMAFAPVAACSTFGVALYLAIRAIQNGEAKAVVVGATDPPPHPLLVGAFYNARVISADKSVSIPLTRLQGTHVAGGSVVWIVGDWDYMKAEGFKPLGMEPVSVGVSSDAEHIITPSLEGPRLAMMDALSEAGASEQDVGTWDLHATATPGDYAEVATLKSVVRQPVLVTARKGTFGHGMGAGGGWELTAQYLGYEAGEVFPTPLKPGELNAAIAHLHKDFVFDAACALPGRLAGKLSMGIGGINACVISRPITEADK